MKLSSNFFLSEFERSQTAARRGIDNLVIPQSRVHMNLVTLCQRVLQPLRDGLGPVHISSGYRCSALNEAIGGSVSSQHCYGLAADIVIGGYSPGEVCGWIKSRNLPFDQLINEYDQWTHVSIAPKGVPRGECLHAIRRDGRTVYLQLSNLQWST